MRLPKKRIMNPGEKMTQSLYISDPVTHWQCPITIEKSGIVFDVVKVGLNECENKARMPIKDLSTLSIIISTDILVRQGVLRKV